MAVGGVNPSSWVQLYTQRREKVTTEKVNDTRSQNEQNSLEADASAEQVDESPAAQLQRFSAAATEMSALLTQIRPRRDSDKKEISSDEGQFDKVLDEDGASKAEHMLKLVRQTPPAQLNHLLQQLRQFLPDESDLVLVLREWLKKKELDELNRGKIEQLLKKAEEEADPRRLKAGINVAIKSRLFSNKLKITPARVRESYRQFLERDLPADVTYREWIISYGLQYRSILTDFMESALLTDIDSLDPSCSIPEFGLLLVKICQVKLLRSSEWLFINGLLQHKTIAKSMGDEAIWLLFLLELLNQEVSVELLFDAIFSERLPENSYSERAETVQYVYRAWGKLPLEMFDDEYIRSDTLRQMESYANILQQQELRQKRGG